MGVTLTAWATIGGELGADPGITVTEYTDLRVTSETDLALSDLEREQLRDDELGGLHYANADRLLAEKGYQRHGEWMNSGGQWAADVTPRPAMTTDEPVKIDGFHGETVEVIIGPQTGNVGLILRAGSGAQMGAITLSAQSRALLAELLALKGDDAEGATCDES